MHRGSGWNGRSYRHVIWFNLHLHLPLGREKAATFQLALTPTPRSSKPSAALHRPGISSLIEPNKRSTLSRTFEFALLTAFVAGTLAASASPCD